MRKTLSAKINSQNIPHTRGTRAFMQPFFVSIFGYFCVLHHVHVHFGTRLELIEKSDDCAFIGMRHLVSLRSQYMAASSSEHLRRRLLRMNQNLQIPVFWC